MPFWKNSRRTILATQIATVIGAGILALPLTFIGAQPAQAQTRVSLGISLNYFSDRLSRYGYWITTERWGRVWQPRRTGFRPYFDGYWEYTRDYGWYWVSDEPWADITYHYGRWVNDPEEGWLWVPGYVWGPAWVIWRDTGSYIGWFPMPPDYYDFYGSGPRYSATNWYGYRDWYGPNFSFTNLWVFVRLTDFGRDASRHYVEDQRRVRTIYNQSSDRTRYEERGDRVVNLGVSRDRLPSSVRKRVPQRSLNDVRKDSTPMASVTQGRTVLREEERNNGQRNGRPGQPATPETPQPQQRTEPRGPGRTQPAPEDRPAGPNRPNSPDAQTQPGQPATPETPQPQQRTEPRGPGRTQTPPAAPQQGERGNRQNAPDAQTQPGQPQPTTRGTTQGGERTGPQQQTQTPPAAAPQQGERDNRQNAPDAQTQPGQPQPTTRGTTQGGERTGPQQQTQTPPAAAPQQGGRNTQENTREGRPAIAQPPAQPNQQQAPQPSGQTTQPAGTGQPNVQSEEKAKEGAKAPRDRRKPGEKDEDEDEPPVKPAD